MYILNDSIVFPPVSHANPDGLLALGGDLSVERLIAAYQQGIFPWFNDDQPIMWFCPDPRMVLYPEEIKVSKSMRKLFRQEAFEVTYNTCFDQVIEQCASIERVDQDGTWITKEMKRSYKKLHQMGIAVSVEVWKENNLVGGLYGVWLREKKVFCGESMFSHVSNASKYGFISWVKELMRYETKIIDCQMYTEHLASLGGREIPREQFLAYLRE
ncbi:leucyl/phenylalanyl-tRNA--protein transferase [Aquimarina hainanensis]|uniref:Leucyl/phenylalanyl-tRNA--protein transferase n=1 Tax=Aquimarina hainanensis TaxID=1578017 RepID=A0ABW5N2P6_9FLAO|nr:leucyl/phenylalanyl-tRNA--protein transferase [Aquimarina sp. TRL1]QKX04449.1 leucyl/phenylalanyl-tRNA--protein transferase [Aquimarina sp. TRL1]